MASPCLSLAPPLFWQMTIELHKQALWWLIADLASCCKLFDTEGKDALTVVKHAMTHWQLDSDLTSVRDSKALEPLPPEERDAWQKLWKDVDARLAKTQEKK
jgi:hypothetical protein